MLVALMTVVWSMPASAGPRSVPLLDVGAAPGPRFKLPYSFPLDYAPLTLVTGRFDGDRFADLALQGGPGVALFAGDSARVLVPRGTLDGALLTAADFDGDGFSDLAVAAPESALGILRCRGDGTFEPQVTLSIGARVAWGLAPDLNGDGRPDLVLFSPFTGEAVALLNSESGSFSVSQRFPCGDVPLSAAAGDFDGDAQTDLAIVNAAGSTGIWAGNGDGTFIERQSLPYGWPTTVAAGDLNGDGVDELVVRPWGGQLRVFRAANDHTLAADTVIVTGGNETQDVAVLDMDRDGHPDLVSIEEHGYWIRSGLVAIYRGLGGGRIGAARRYFLEAGMGGLGLSHPIAGDFNGDGRPDLACVSDVPTTAGSNLVVIAGDPAAGLAAVENVQVPWDPTTGAGPWRVAPATLKSHGPPDLLVQNTNVYTNTGAVYLLRNEGAGGFGAPEEIGGGWIAGTADVNGDGLTDLAVSSSDSVAFYPADGTGGFGMPTHYAAGRFLALADFDGVHGPDLVVSDALGRALLLPNDGAGSFGTRIVIGTLPPGAVTASRGADLDGDGLAELIVGGLHRLSYFDPDTLSVFWNSGGRLDCEVAYPIGLSSGTSEHPYYPGSATDIQTGDFNGDGRRDIAVVSGNLGDEPGSFAILLGASGRQFEPRADYSTAREPYTAAVVDLDGDGLDDVAVASAYSNDTGRLGVWCGNAGGTLDQLPLGAFGGLLVDHYSVGVCSADFDGDGAPDVATANHHGASVSILRAVPHDAVTPALLSLAGAEASADRVRLRWYAPAGAAVSATVERRAPDRERTAIGTVHADGEGSITFEDAAVRPGDRYGYRLALAGAPGRYSSETWVVVPLETIFALEPVRPNPSHGECVAEFTLAAPSRCALELLDVGGRRVFSKVLGTLTAGRHLALLDPGRSLAPGLYFMRLRASGRSAVRRVVLTR